MSYSWFIVLKRPAPGRSALSLLVQLPLVCSNLGRFAQADTVIPDPNNPLDWDRYSYVQNNPVIYTDPSGHRTCDINDACNGVLPDLDQVETVTKQGKELYDMYVRLNNKKGWWNNDRKGGLSPEQFWGLWTLWERGGNPGLQQDLTEAVKNQLWMDDRSRLGRDSYCKGEACFFSIGGISFFTTTKFILLL